MGRIRGKTTRQYTLEVLKLRRFLFTDNFETNKEMIKELFPESKIVRNKVAGFITNLAKQKKLESFIIEHSAK
ncbi:30S ribosomal protein S17e [Candidatus Parvarchaeota archaeon]|jgi:Ribosomal protein S17E|uniref:30S ribosomal protein S17e n=1 Tax=Candidatus Acidifodinimicrobium mancum TaxID=2898728 RepID=A0A8T3USN5_9ARCH|nr:30S ribosomal protein S17e [Candidatus Acidifodinimicrobium mancum]MBE5728886.1 30S ribosomal protein S17e [Candidatus Acidifodinimicrobium mancum]MBE5729366.1 30S ribosomal protein S17e [Candidatus Acidifodinimicrobium mancum]MBE5730123.1 30S ribosomal protein S17e [Candidatus Acidifodinimicrobium mancum]